MTSPRKNSILINDEAFGALDLIENQIFSKFNRLMRSMKRAFEAAGRCPMLSFSRRKASAIKKR